MICLCETCKHYNSCYGTNDDYADDEGGLCVHYRRNDTKGDEK